MENIKKITDRIAANTQAEIDALNAQTDAKCAEIKAAGDKSAQEEYWRLFKKGTAEATQLLERLNSAADMDAKKQVLAEKQILLAEAFDYAAKRLHDLPEETYIALLAKLAADAAVSGEETIILSAEDRSKLGTKILSAANARLKSAGKNASLTLSEETRQMTGGLILSAGNIEMNCTLDVLVGGMKDEMSALLAKLLFE